MGTELIERAPEIGAGFRELGGWGVAIVFMGLSTWLLTAYFRLQNHVLKLSTVLSVANSKTVASLNVVGSRMAKIEDQFVELRPLASNIKQVENKLDKVNERVIELCAKGGRRET